MPDSVSTLEETSAEGAEAVAPIGAEADDLLEDSLVEEVSIDGMCGVY